MMTAQNYVLSSMGKVRRIFHHEEPLHIYMTGPKSLMDATTNSVDALINEAARAKALFAADIAAQNRIWCQWGDESISIAATGIIATIGTR